MNEENSKLHRSFVYVILVLLFLVYAGFTFVALRSYIPYSFDRSFNSGVNIALWSLMRLPAVVLPIALWLANMLNRRLNSFSLLSVLLTSCFVVAVPGIYKLGDAYEMSYLTSVFAFFLITCTCCVLIRDLKGDKKLHRAVNIIATILLVLMFMAFTLIIGFILFSVGRLYGIALCMLIPFICSIAVLESLLDVYSKGTYILKLTAVGIGCLCAGIIDLCTKLPVTVYVLVSALALIWQLIDLGKYIIVRRDKNDSESCNA